MDELREENNVVNCAEDNYEDCAENNIGNSEIKDKVLKLIKKGNLCRLIIRKNGNILLNVPLNVTIVGTILVPWATIFAAIASAGFNCSVELVNEQGIITDINGKVKGTYTKMAQVGKKAADVVGKAKGVVDNVTEEINK